MRYYYVDRESKIVFVYDKEILTEMEYLGATDNPLIKMAVSHFLKGESNYSIKTMYNQS
jgi:hypothetical protein